MVLRRTAQKESGYSLKFDRLRLTSYVAMEQLRRYLELGEELYNSIVKIDKVPTPLL